MRTTIRTGDDGQNFEETTRGELPHSISLDTTARGEVQINVKLYFDSDAINNVSALTADLWLHTARQLSLRGVRVAGYGGQEAR